MERVLIVKLITFIGCCKKFIEEYNAIQNSALYSWMVNDIPVILPNNEVGVKEKCASYPNVRVIEGVKRGWDIGLKTGTVILTSLVDAVLPLIHTPMIGIICPDMLVLSDFENKLKAVLDRCGFDAFLAGGRQDIKLEGIINTPSEYNKAQKASRAFQEGRKADIFVLSKFWLKKMRQTMPELLIGRTAWNTWMYKWAEFNVAHRYDCTKALPFLHCDHDNRLIFMQEGKAIPSSKYNQSLWEKTAEALYKSTTEWPLL